MDPIITPLALALAKYIATHAVVFAVVSLTAITLATLAEWFQQREELLDKNKGALAFTIGAMIDNKQFVEFPGLFSGKAGSTRIVQGIYDKKTNKILEMRALTANKIAPEIAQAHAHDNLVIYSR
jgi:hypothetical protein